jgi:MFS family permease
MGGVFVGPLGGGQLADVIGRKPTFYLTVLVMMVGNVSAIFSTSWMMFAGE